MPKPNRFAGFLPEPAFVMGFKNLVEDLSTTTRAATTQIATRSNTAVTTAERSPSKVAVSHLGSDILFVQTSQGSPESQTLLYKMIEAMGIPQHQAQLVLVNGNSAQLEDQIHKFKPKMVVSFGLKRQKIHAAFGTQIMTTFDPEYLIQNPAAKKECWADLQLVMKELGFKK